MTDYPRPGDRVKITLEGEVREVDPLRRHVTLIGTYGKVPIPPGSVEVTRIWSYPEGTVAVGESAPDKPAVKRSGRWTPDEHWRLLTDNTVRSSPFWTVVHEPQAN